MVYLDDITVLSKTFEQHLSNLEVFRRLETANLKMNPKKCNFLQKEVKYLGHTISENWKGTDPEKLEAVENWPVPKNVEDIRSF